ncbi:hypothetical protein I4J03_02775 [Corynebacterium diphtheriae bv. mitis]|uniref:DUF3592 domain-containing protein n=1 Tax=Corynebacterium diphtheriae TaxID=1717 RepID=UPI0018CA2B23|nr:hypothetical protein [Corynebacterium diphtheriae bv. mitis]
MKRRLHQLVLALYAAAVLGCASMVIGPAINDYHITRNSGRVLAKVLDVGTFRTTVEYQDEDNMYHSPKGGLMYPTGLGRGQRVWVNYSKDNPDLVKVEGRAWTLAIIPALSIWVVASLIFAGLWWILGRL